MPTKRLDIYYVEDDASIAESVACYMMRHDSSCTVLGTIEIAKRALTERRPDIVLVDWNMPDGQGDLLCRWIRAQWSDLPIILLTARGASRDIVAGFQSGADDYVVKPFDLEVLYSRISALLRRVELPRAARLCCERLTLDTEQRSACYDGEEIDLSQSEYQLLFQLVKNKGRTVTRRQLLELIWDVNGNFVNDNTLTVTMKRLREKLNNPPFIKTIRSIGYRAEDGI